MPTVHQDAVNTWKQSFTLCYVLIFVLFCFVFVDDDKSLNLPLTITVIKCINVN